MSLIRYILIPLKDSQQIGVIPLYDLATSGKYSLCEPVSFIRICNQVESGYVVIIRGRTEQLTYCFVINGLVNYIASVLH